MPPWSARSPHSATGLTWHEVPPRLEDVFIHLLSRADGGGAMNGFSWRRFLAVLRKEWIQVRRDPFTLRMIMALPVLQLFLFGYAINADPKHLPTGLLSADHSKYERTLVAAMQNTGYYDIRTARLRGGGGARAGRWRAAVRGQHPARFRPRGGSRRAARC